MCFKILNIDIVVSLFKNVITDIDFSSFNSISILCYEWIEAVLSARLIIGQLLEYWTVCFFLDLCFATFFKFQSKVTHIPHKQFIFPIQLNLVSEPAMTSLWWQTEVVHLETRGQIVKYIEKSHALQKCVWMFFNPYPSWISI